MTFVLTLQTEHSIWLVADTRLTGTGGYFRDDGSKVFTLGTSDGTAIIGYSGLGSTENQTQPSEWMSRVLRGPKRTLIQSLDAISAAMNEQFPKHAGSALDHAILNHQALIPTIANESVALYLIRFVPGDSGEPGSYRFCEVTAEGTDPPRAPPAFATGSMRALEPSLIEGTNVLRLGPDWERQVDDLYEAAADAGKDPQACAAVAKRLADFIPAISKVDVGVGPRCVIVYRWVGGGGAHVYFNAGVQEADCPPLDDVSDGMSMKSILGVLMEMMPEALLHYQAGDEAAAEAVHKEIGRRVNQLPHTPDTEMK